MGQDVGENDFNGSGGGENSISDLNTVRISDSSMEFSTE